MIPIILRKVLGLNQNDVLEIMSAAYSVGGGSVHGTSDQRLSAVYFGATDGAPRMWSQIESMS